MKVEQKNIDDLSATLRLTIEKSDYEPRVKKNLNDYRRKADIKGFRQGMAPMSIIEKIHGKSALLDEVNKLMSEGINKHITDNQLNLLGEPIPSETEQKPLDWDGDSDFEFVFEIGFAPKIEFTLSEKDKIPVYTISVTNEDKEKYKDSILRQNGKPEGEGEERKIVPAELNQELYDRLFGKDVVKTEAEFMQKLEEQIREQHLHESDYRFTIDAYNALLKKAKIELPDKFLKAWLRYSNEGKMDDALIEKEYPLFADDLRRQMIRGYILREQKIELKQDDLLAHARKMAQYQFSMYGLHNAPEEQLTHYANSILANEKEWKRIYEKVESDKVIEYVKSVVTLDKQEITMDKLLKMYEAEKPKS